MKKMDKYKTKQEINKFLIINKNLNKFTNKKLNKKIIKKWKRK